MKTKIKIVRKEEQETSTWAGGTTTQLAIWPPDSDYKRRDFSWRISSARVDLEESTFTSLPGFHRILMALEGSVRLMHEGYHEKMLNSFDQDAFEGEWTTTSRGRCVDFNLMTAVGSEGQVEALKNREKEMEIEIFPSEESQGGLYLAETFYCLQDGVCVTITEETDSFKAELRRGDFLMLETVRQDGDKSLLVRALLERNGEEEIWGVRTMIRSSSAKFKP